MFMKTPLLFPLLTQHDFLQSLPNGATLHDQSERLNILCGKPTKNKCNWRKISRKGK